MTCRRQANITGKARSADAYQAVEQLVCDFGETQERPRDGVAAVRLAVDKGVQNTHAVGIARAAE